MEYFWEEVLQFAQMITQNIGSQLINDFAKVKATRKRDGTLITQADQWADLQIRAAIASQFPTHGIITEETEHILPDTEWCWVVDPIDGTTNFTRGIPIWGISLGLLYRGTPVFGFVHFPMLEQSFYGYWEGDSGISLTHTGAYMNQESINTSPDFPSQNHLFNLCARSTEVINKDFPCKIRIIGVASYNILLVACGAALGGVEATPKIWDIAAAWVIIQAAGGVFVPLEPKPIFPLKIGENYGSRPFPCLMVSQPKLVPVFKPLVAFIGEKVLKSQRL